MRRRRRRHDGRRRRRDRRVRRLPRFFLSCATRMTRGGDGSSLTGGARSRCISRRRPSRAWPSSSRGSGAFFFRFLLLSPFSLSLLWRFFHSVALELTPFRKNRLQLPCIPRLVFSPFRFGVWEGRASHTVYPPPRSVFSALNLTPLHRVKGK